jgi:hypothetical protein
MLHITLMSINATGVGTEIQANQKVFIKLIATQKTALNKLIAAYINHCRNGTFHNSRAWRKQVLLPSDATIMHSTTKIPAASDVI